MLLTATPSSLFISSPQLPVISLSTLPAVTTIPPDRPVDLVSRLHSVVPAEIRALTPQEEQQIGRILSDYFSISVSAQIEGKRLNRSYGYIGAEQHLARFPGDSLDAHFDSDTEATLYSRSGMAPDRGAWGYFADSRGSMTEEDVLREKYYIAVQTFLAPDYNSRYNDYRDFFKFRKMLLVNPQNGKAIVADIGDSGPAVWTGKQLGGSPEVMHYLGRVDGRARGAVLYFFISDPDNHVPLGPVRI